MPQLEHVTTSARTVQAAAAELPDTEDEILARRLRAAE